MRRYISEKMNKAISYSNHFVEDKENIPPQHGLKVVEKTFQYADMNNGVVRPNKAFSDNVDQFAGEIKTSKFHLSTGHSITDEILLKEGLSAQTIFDGTGAMIKTNDRSQIEMPSMQFNNTRDERTAAENNLHLYQMPADRDQLIQINRETTEEFETPDKSYKAGSYADFLPNNNSSYKSISNTQSQSNGNGSDGVWSQNEMSSADALISLTGPHTTTIQEENYEMSRLYPEMIKMEAVPDKMSKAVTSEGQASEIEDPVKLHELTSWDAQQNVGIETKASTSQTQASPDGVKVPASENHSDHKPIPSDAVSPTTALQQSTQQNFKQTILNFAIKPTVSSSVNGIVIQSNELIKLPPVGTVIQIPSNSLVPTKAHQIKPIPYLNVAARKSQTIRKNSAVRKSNATLPMNGGKSSYIPVPRAQLIPKETKTIPKKNAATTTHIPTSTSIHMANDSDWSAIPTVPIPIKNGSKRKSTPTIANQPLALKRKNDENIGRVIPAKMHRVEQPVQVAMTDITDAQTTVNLPEITIAYVDAVGCVKHSVSGVNLTYSNRSISEKRSLSECFKMLERNNCTIFRVPKKQSSTEVAFEKLKKTFANTNVQIKRLNKN